MRQRFAPTPGRVPHRVAGGSLQPDENGRQSGLADGGGHEAVAAAGCGRGQRASSQPAAGGRFSEAPGLLHQQVVSLLCLLQPRHDWEQRTTSKVSQR